MRRYLNCKLLLGIFLCQILIISLAAASSVTTTLDRNQIALGETFKLTVTLNGEFSSNSVDTSALENDFIIVSSMVSPQMTVINGTVSQRTDINLMLAPKKMGRLTIPSISIGKYSSEPTTINVTKESIKANDKQMAFLEAEVDNKSPFVQSQIVYRIRLFYATNISRGTLSDPVIKNAIVMPLGEDKEYQKMIQSTLYQVHERFFAIFPERSGPLTIDPTIFSGMKSSNLSAQNFNQFFADTQIPIKLISQAITLNVKPAPLTSAQQHWLPSKNLSLEETWSVPNPPVIGSPITRTIKIKGVGNIHSQLPKLNINNNLSPQINVYSDNLKTKNNVVNEDIVGESQQNIAYIPSQAGEITLPEISIPWWDSVNNQPRVAKLPSKKIMLIATTQDRVTPTETKNATPIVAQQPQETKSIQSPYSMWPYITLLIILLWIATVIFFYRHKIVRNKTRAKKETSLTSEGKIIRQLKTACLQQNAAQVKSYVEAWAKQHWPENPTLNLGWIAKEINDPVLSPELLNLSTVLYSSKKLEWDGEKFWQAFQSYQLPKPAVKKAPKKFDLPPMYPRTTAD